MAWNDLSPEQMARLVAIYRNNPDDPALHATLPELGIADIQTLQRHCRNYLQYERVFMGDQGVTLPDDDLDLEAPIQVPTESVSRLTDIGTPDQDTDQDQWVSWLSELFRGGGFIKVMHLCDIHFPFQDNNALALAYKVVERVQPDVIVVGSDAIDFHQISSFGSDPDVKTEFDDELDLFEHYWNQHIHTLRAAAPDAKLVYVMGNHERRIIRYVINQAPALRKRIWRDFIKIVRCGGAVLWLGETDRVRMGPLLVQHGNRHGKYASKSLLEDLGYQVSTIFGHIHKRNVYAKTGEDFTVQAEASGCLCELRPHYVRGTSLRDKWEHGTIVAGVNLHSREVYIQNLTFNQVQGKMRTFLNMEQDHEDEVWPLPVPRSPVDRCLCPGS